MDTRDQFLFDQMNYPSSYLAYHNVSAYCPVVDVRLPTTYYRNDDCGYEQPTVPFLAAPSAPTVSLPPPPPRYRAIQPRPDTSGIQVKSSDDTPLLFELRKGRRGRMPRKSQQKRNRKSKSTRRKADTNKVTSTKPESQSSTVFNRCTNSDPGSSSQQSTFAPGVMPPTNDAFISGTNQSSIFPNYASETPAHIRSTDHPDVHGSLVRSDNHSQWPSMSLGIRQSQDYVEVACDELAVHLEKEQALQSLYILQDYMAKHPSIFEEQAPETVHRWLAGINSMNQPGSCS